MEAQTLWQQYCAIKTELPSFCPEVVQFGVLAGELATADLTFTLNMRVVCEKFEGV